tara:strand:+ start:9 stop:557 length:549 start_codon:yes stop_codon:yes gene_type:complete
MDDVNWMISLLSEFLSEEKEELVFLDLWDKVPDVVPFEEVFHAQIEFKSERQSQYIQLYGGDPRVKRKTMQITSVLNYQNALAFKEVCKQNGHRHSTLLKQWIHEYLVENNIKPFFIDINKKYTMPTVPVMETRPFDLESAHHLQFDNEIIDLEKDIECEEAHHPTLKQNRWYWRRNAFRYW